MKLRNKIINEIAENNFSHITTNISAGFDACEAHYLPIIEKLESALKFYSLKSNYSLVDEGRNYHSDYKCYELNEITYGDEELGTKAQQALAELEHFKNKMNGDK